MRLKGGLAKAAALAGLLAMTGCLGAAPAEQEEERELAVSRPADGYDGPDGVTDWGGQERLVLVDFTAEHVAAGECIASAYPELEMPRTEGRVLNRTSYIEFRVAVESTMVGVQVGYAVDDGRATWLETAWGKEANGAKTMTAEVDPSTYEAGGREPPRWTFLWRQNYPVVDSEDWCYIGASAGKVEFDIEAIKAD